MIMQNVTNGMDSQKEQHRKNEAETRKDGRRQVETSSK